MASLTFVPTGCCCWPTPAWAITRCVECLRAKLDVPLSAATVGLFEELRVG